MVVMIWSLKTRPPHCFSQQLWHFTLPPAGDMGSSPAQYVICFLDSSHPGIGVGGIALQFPSWPPGKSLFLLLLLLSYKKKVGIFF